MSRIAIPAREDAPEKSQPLLDAVEKQLGVVPNLFRLVGTSPAALEGYLGLNGALGRTLDARGRVSDGDLAEVRLAGFSEAQVIEIVAAVALNVLTNYVNNVAQTDIDFPVVLAAEAA